MPGAPTTSLSFATASSSAGEADGTVGLVLSIADPSSTNATSVDVVLASGDAARIGGYTTQTVTWPANDVTDKTLTITITDNAACDGDAVLGFQLQSATGGDDAEVGANDAHALTIVDDDSAPLPAPVATAATAIGDNGFTANWEAVTGATGYFLDVYSSNAVLATDLFISEYIEGTGSNKFIELYNGTGAAVDLSDYELRLFANGSISPTSTVLSGALANGGTITYGNTAGSLFGATGAIALNTICNFNGDDAVALWKVSTASYVDIFGTIGEDPGSAWTDGGLSTVDRTLVRKSDVIGGVTTNPGSGFPTLVTEWDGFPQDNIDDLGSHTYTGTGLALVPGYENLSVGNVLTYPVTGLDPGVTYYYVVRAANACVTSDDSNVQEVTTTVPSATIVAFATASSSAGEADGTVDLVLSITDPSSTNATSVDVVLASGDAARIGGYTTQTVTWPANDATDKTLTITITDNAACDGDAVLGFQLQNATGGDDAEVGANDAHALTIVDDDSAPLPAPVATAATAIGDNGFTANWEAVTGATGYYLDVYSLNAVLATDLFISEYIEGSSNNKYIEVFNGTGAAVDLSGYEVLVFSNGSSTTSNTIALTGTLADGDVHVLAHSQADLPGAPVDQTTGALGYNGDDALALWKISTASYVDIFGTIGEDPGTEWTDGGLSTLNQTLVRKSEVTGGVTTNPGSGFPTLATEWDGFPEDNIDDLGSHTYAGTGLVLVPGYENLSVGNVLTYPVTGLDPGVTYYYVVRAANACVTSDDSNVQEVTTTVPVVPVLTAVPDALDFGDVAFGTTSASMSFELSGTDLEPVSGSVTLEVPPGLEVELSLSEVLWETEVSVPYTGGELLPVTVYVRFSPSAIGAQSDAIAISGGGAVTAVNITGTGAEAQIYWDFQTETPTLDLVPFTSTSAISRGQHNNTSGDLVNDTSPSGGYPGASGQNNAAAAAFTDPLDPGTSTYFEFTVTTAPGRFTHFHTFSFGTRSTNTGPQAYSIRWSLDNYATDLASGTLNNNSTWVLKEHTGLELLTPPGGAVTFRIFGHSGTGNPGTSANWRIDDLALYGDSYEAADIYYSRATGTADQPIWSDTPTGTAGPAVFGPGVGMVVQAGDAVTVTASMAIGTLEVESGATLELGNGTTFDLHGDALIDGDLVANESEIALVGGDGVILQSAGTLDLYDLTVNTPNGALTDAVIAIRGTLQLTDGEFESEEPITLVSDEDGTAQMGPVGTNAEYVGALTVQRYIPGGATNWRLLGSPVAGATVNDWMDDFFTAGFPGSHWPEFYDTPYGGYEPGAEYWPSVRMYVETLIDPDPDAGLIGVESQNTPLSFGRGFAAWSGDNDQGTAGFTVDVTGAPHVAKTPAALPVSWTELTPADPAAQGWNLVSNPLPAPIDFSLMVRGADVANGYYVYDPATGNNAHWDAEILVSTPPGAVHGIIHSSQGFWVQASGPAATLTVDESAKVDVATGGLFGGDQMPTVGQLRLVIEHGANAMRDEARVFFGLGQPGHDGGDALKLPVGHQHAPRIATRSSDGMDMMVNKYGAYEQAISIPVTVRAALTGTHTITLYTAHIGLSCLTLEDLHTGATMPVTDGTTYSFAQDSTGNAAIVRFMLHASAPVPFTAEHGTCGPLSGRAEVQLATPTDVALSSAGVVLEQYTAAMGTLVFDGLAAGAYTITAGSTTACGTLAHTFTIATAGAPVEVALDVPAEAVVLEAFGLHATATEGAALTWDLGDGTTATGAHVMHTYGAPGTYTVGLTATLDDCTVTATTTVVVGASTGIGTHAAEAVQVWHDGGHFVVEHGMDHGGTLTIEVLDATGRLHATAGTVARPGRVLVPAQGLAAGVWFVRISDADRQHTVRVPVLR